VGNGPRQPDHLASQTVSEAWRLKRMQVTKLRAAPERQAEVPPCAPAGKTDGGTASQLIRSVGRTSGRGVNPERIG
jgi:hypothetical protein